MNHESAISRLIGPPHHAAVRRAILGALALSVVIFSGISRAAPPPLACPMAEVSTQPEREVAECPECAAAAYQVHSHNLIVQAKEAAYRASIRRYNALCGDVIECGEVHQEESCDDGEKVKLFTAVRKEGIAGSIGPFESLVTPGYKEFGTYDELIALVEANLRKPIDPNGKCRDCLGYLKIVMHAGDDDRREEQLAEKAEVEAAGGKYTEIVEASMRGIYRFGDLEIADYLVDPETKKFKMKPPYSNIVKKLDMLRGYLCRDSQIVLTHCNIARGEEGKLTGQALADYLGVPVLAPDFSAHIHGCPNLDSPRGSYDDKDYQIFRPEEPLLPPCERARAEHKKKLQKARVEMLKLKREYEIKLRLLKAAVEKLRECEENRCPKLATEPNNGALLVPGEPGVKGIKAGGHGVKPEPEGSSENTPETSAPAGGRAPGVQGDGAAIGEFPVDDHRSRSAAIDKLLNSEVCTPCRSFQRRYRHAQNKLDELAKTLSSFNQQRVRLSKLLEDTQDAATRSSLKAQLRVVVQQYRLHSQKWRSLAEAINVARWNLLRCLARCGQLPMLPDAEIEERTPASISAFYMEYDFGIFLVRPICLHAECVKLADEINRKIIAWLERFYPELDEILKSYAATGVTIKDGDKFMYNYRMDFYSAFIAQLQKWRQELKVCEEQHCTGSEADIEEIIVTGQRAWLNDSVQSGTTETKGDDGYCVEKDPTAAPLMSGPGGNMVVLGGGSDSPDTPANDCPEIDADDQPKVAIDSPPADADCIEKISPIVPITGQPKNLQKAEDVIKKHCPDTPVLHWLTDYFGYLPAQGSFRSSQRVFYRAPNDPAFSAESTRGAETNNQWGLRRINLYPPEASTATHSPASEPQTVLVAIVDSGIDFLHPELFGKLWRNPLEIAGNGIDEDRNGYIDDVYGWNFVASTNLPQDNNGHGTAVAGIVNAATDNGKGMAGVNPLARLLPVKTTNFVGNGYSDHLAEGIRYAANMGARVINVSLGGVEFSPEELDAANYANELGALVVVAAGNLNTSAEKFWPAGLDGVVTVAATDTNDSRAVFSNWGQSVDLAAPGVDIVSLRAHFTDMLIFADPEYTRGKNILGSDKLLYRVSGTSFAAPFVSGVASLIFSYNPDLSPQEVKRMLLNSAQDIAGPGIDILTGYGLLNASAALTANPRFFIDARISGVRMGSDGTSLEVLGTADADEFGAAKMTLGIGVTPDSWQPLEAALSQTVREDVLIAIPLSTFSAGKQWTLRLEVEHDNGKSREYRFTLNLG